MEYHEYENRYGSKKARKLIQTLYGRYQRAILLKNCLQDYGQSYRDRLEGITDFFGWELVEINTDLTLLTALLKGLPGKDIICIKPGQLVTEEVFGHSK
jgi:hypothetical protein